MGNGFKKGVSLLVTAGLLASLAATAFAGTAAAAVSNVPTAVNVPGDAAYTPLTSNVVTLNGIDDIYAPYAGANLRFHVGNGFELDTTAAITATVVQGGGGLLLGASGPGALTQTVYPVTNASESYFDLNIWQSSGDCTVTNCTLTIAGGAVRQRAGAAAAGDVVDINHNSTDPGDAVASPFTIYTLTGTVGASMFHISVVPSSFTADAVNPQATATAVSDNVDWAGNAGAAPVTSVGSWTTECGTITSTGLMTADITNCHTAGTHEVTATSILPVAGIVGVGSFLVYPGVLTYIDVLGYDGDGDPNDIANYVYSDEIAVGESRQFIAQCRDAWGNLIAQTGFNGSRPYDCWGSWSDTPHPGAAEINYTGLLTGIRLGQIEHVTYTVGNIAGQSGHWQVVSGPRGGAALPAEFVAMTQTAPVIRAGGFGTTAASYTYTEPVWIYSPWISGAALFPLGGFTWTIDISDAQGNRTVSFDTSKSPSLVAPGSMECQDASFIGTYVLQVSFCATNPLQVEGLTIGNLFVKATADAALGNIRTRYSLDTDWFTFGGQFGRRVWGYWYDTDGLGNLRLRNVSAPGFVPSDDFNGPLNFTDSTSKGGASTDTADILLTGPYVLGNQDIRTGVPGKPHAFPQWVYQDQDIEASCLSAVIPVGIHNYGRCKLDPIGVVVDSLKLTTSPAMVQRGLPNRLPFGTFGIEERTTGALGNGSSSGLLAVGTIINLKLDSTQGVVFSEPPTAKVTWTKAGAFGHLPYLLLKDAAQQQQQQVCGYGPGALSLPIERTSGGEIGSADFAPTAENRSNLYINPAIGSDNPPGAADGAYGDGPWTFDNIRAIPTTNNVGADLARSTWHGYYCGTPVGQDVYGAALADLGLGQAPLTLRNPSSPGGVYPTLINPLDYNTTVYVADLSPDRLTASFVVRTADLGNVTSKLLIDGFVDVSAAATAGGPVTMTVETAAGSAAAGVKAAASSIPVVPGSVTIGTINNTVDGTAQAVPSVVIGANDQATGTVVIREAAAGMLGAGWGSIPIPNTVPVQYISGPTNVLRVCYVSNTGKPEVFTRAPWLVVTNGDLKLRSNSDPSMPWGTATPGTGVRGYIGAGGSSCAQWIVANASTTASTLEIRGSASDGTMLPSGPNNGPKVNVDPQQKPGPVTLNLWEVPVDWFSLGSVPASWTQFALVQNAVRVYGANVAVAAVSQPEIRKGKIAQPAGDVTITESATFQLGNYVWWLGGTGQQAIWFQIVPNNLRDVLPSVYFNTDRVAPVVSTNSSESGLIAQFGRWWNNTTFTVVTAQRAFVPVVGAWVPGKITVSGLAYSVTNDAALGPVQLQVCSTGNMNVSSPSDFAVCPGVQAGLFVAAENPANFNQVVSNAKVVEDSSILGAIAPGVAGPGTNKWTFNTVIVKKGTYVTLRLQAVKGAVVGDRIEIWGRAGKTGTWKKLTTRLVGANGYIFYFKKVSGYTEFQALFAGSDTAAASYAVPRYYRATVKK